MSDRGELEIFSETTMCEQPRGREGREVLRVRFVMARTPDGKSVAWHDIREFYKADDGSWRHGKRGISIRARELRAVADALQKAASGEHAPSARVAASRPAPAHREVNGARSAPAQETPPAWLDEGPLDALPPDLEKDLF
jgi:hypothetical protein